MKISKENAMRVQSSNFAKHSGVALEDDEGGKLKMSDADCGQGKMVASTVDALYVNGTPIACHRLAKDGKLYVCEHDKEAFNELVDGNIGDQSIGDFAAANKTMNLLSQWKEWTNGYLTGYITVYNSDMEKGAVRVKRWFDSITIDVYVNFEGELNPRSDSFWNSILPTYFQLKFTPHYATKLIVKGIKKWADTYEGSGFDNFGCDPVVNVQVNVHESHSDEEFPCFQKFVDIDIDKVGRAYQTSKSWCMGNLFLGGSATWKIDNLGHIHIFDSGLTESGEAVQYSDDGFSSVAAHEMGHVFGLGDAYTESPRTVGVSEEVGPDDMMRSNAKVYPNDIEMLLLAWKENERQYYADVDQYGQKKSQAIMLPYYG